MNLFVYGTLKAGGTRAGLLGSAPREEARVRGRLYDLPAGYPALVLGEEGWVYGELVEVEDERMLGLLDLYEGVGEGLFRRTRIDVQANLRTIEAWVWVMDDAVRRGGRLVRSGKWRHIKRH